MKRARWDYCAVSLLALVACCAHPCAAADSPGTALTHVARAEIAFEHFARESWPDSPATVPENLEWHAERLPFVGLRQLQRNAALRSNVRVWVRFSGPNVAKTGDAPQALAYSAFLASGSHAHFYVNAQQFASTDDTLDNAWNQPVLAVIPNALAFSAEGMQLVVAFDCSDGLLGCGVPSMRVGALSAVSVFHEHERFLRVEAPRIGSLALLLVGLFTFVFWVRRRHESVYALFFVATALWAFRSLHYYLPHYPQPSDWFWWGTVNSLSWLAVTVYLFAFRLQGQRWRRTEQTLIGAAVLQSLASLPPIGNDAWVAQLLTYTLQMLLDLAITVILTVVAFRFRSREHTLLVVALWLMFLMGAYDLLLFRWQIGFEHVFLQPYSALPLFAAFIYAMARRYRRAIDEAESLNRSLEQRLGERQRELGASYERLRDYEISHAQGEERQRLMREMHDGIGSTLVATLALVERGNSTPELLARSLREAVDELRLTIDSLEPVDHDLVTLLATVRYRLAPRLERAGLEVDWRVSDLPPLDWLDARSALQILRILQEAVTNVLKHAGATRIEVSTTIDTQVCVRIADNGSGFDVVAMQPGGSRGLRNMRLRALQIGATLQWESGPQGTTVSLQLPLSA